MVAFAYECILGILKYSFCSTAYACSFARFSGDGLVVELRRSRNCTLQIMCLFTWYYFNYWGVGLAITLMILLSGMFAATPLATTRTHKFSYIAHRNTI
jgi:hypothetical protein